jgi:hypothetical protein
MKKWFPQADQTAVPRGSSEQSAENVTAPLIAGHHAIGKEEADSARMIVDHPEGYVGRCIDTIFFAG